MSVERDAAESKAVPQIQSSPCMQGETVVFTGTLASMTHRDAQWLVEQHGGRSTRQVSGQTTLLVVGEEGWPLEPDGRPSQNLLQAKQLHERGSELRIINESDWLYAMGLNERRQEVHRSYTPAMLSKLLDVSVGEIRSWARGGLIRPVRQVYRLPYFDFQEVTSARRLCELVRAGVSIEEIKHSLGHLEAMLGDMRRPLAQLNILAQDTHLLVRDAHGLIQPTTGQRLFDFEGSARSAGDADSEEPKPPGADAPGVAALQFASAQQAAVDRGTSKSAEEFFQEACELAERGDLTAAIHALRLCLMQVPGDPEFNFHLADLLYRQGAPHGALERFYVAVECDRHYLEAWTQIGCLQLELGDLQAALDAFSIALELHPEYPDAHWHIASVYQALGQDDVARSHWQTYLTFDSRGPWAEGARQRLEGHPPAAEPSQDR